MVVCGGWKERTERTESVEEGERSKTTIMTYRRCVVVIIIVVRMGASVCVCMWMRRPYRVLCQLGEAISEGSDPYTSSSSPDSAPAAHHSLSLFHC